MLGGGSTIWRAHKGPRYLLDYTNEAYAEQPQTHESWTGFSVAVADYEFEYDNLQPYYNIKGKKVP